MVQYNAVTAAEIPLDPITRSKFECIDKFVQGAVDSPRYKPIWNGESLLINFSGWCKYELLSPNGQRQPMPPNTTLGSGMYSVCLQASHVYVGPHKSGQTFSVSLHIVELLYEPEQNLTDFIEDIMKTPPCSPPPTVPSAPKRRTYRRKPGLAAPDASKSVFTE